MFGSALVKYDSMLTPVVTLVAYPGTGVGVWNIDSIRVFISSGGGSNPTYQWYINGHPISGATNASFTNYKFFNKDSVTVLVTASGPCGGLTTSKSLIISLFNVGVNTVGENAANIKLIPKVDQKITGLLPNRALFLPAGRSPAKTPTETKRSERPRSPSEIFSIALKSGIRATKVPAVKPFTIKARITPS